MIQAEQELASPRTMRCMLYKEKPECHKVSIELIDNVLCRPACILKVQCYEAESCVLVLRITQKLQLYD